MSVARFFTQAAHWASRQCGSPWTFGLAVFVVLFWAIAGPVFGFSDTWQLVINTGTTIVTFLMVFLIQNTQNRDATAVQLKLDELIRTNTAARNRLLTLEDLTDAELETVKESFARIAQRGGMGRAATLAATADIKDAEEGIANTGSQVAKATSVRRQRRSKASAAR